ncbi:MAG: hypothetical protein E6X17_05860 [Sporomusaceae bacterium]|nr:hypothetical protein [Sporomusaceae bacterium]
MRYELDSIPATLINALEEWKKAGYRSVTIMSEADSQGWKIWIYDFNARNGIHLHPGIVSGNWDKMITDSRRQLLLAELAALDSVPVP